MKKLVLALICLSLAPLSAQQNASPDAARWEKQAQNVTIIRDDWGIPHVYGKTDADAVFGVIYAQAEDDFNRVETNYLNSIGRLAEAEGESAIYQDLRMKIFIDPADMKAQYEKSPAWLKPLMNAWADGLNFYLSTHPKVKPRVDHALRAVDGADLQRREHRRRHRAREPEPARRPSMERRPPRLRPSSRTLTSSRPVPTAWRSRRRIRGRSTRCC